MKSGQEKGANYGRRKEFNDVKSGGGKKTTKKHPSRDPPKLSNKRVLRGRSTSSLRRQGKSPRKSGNALAKASVACSHLHNNAQPDQVALYLSFFEKERDTSMEKIRRGAEAEVRNVSR